MYKIFSDIVLCAEFATKYMRRYFCAYYWSKLGLGQGEAFRLDKETPPIMQLLDISPSLEILHSYQKLENCVIRNIFHNLFLLNLVFFYQRSFCKARPEKYISFNRCPDAWNKES